MGTGSSVVGVREGRRYTVADLWRGVFLRSGNDAVHVLAAMNGGWRNTAEEMQETARKLGARDTTVKSPDGYDAPGQVSSAYDLTVFARAGLVNDDFARYCATPRAAFPGSGGTTMIENTNRMLVGSHGLSRYPGIIGVKNGYTSKAGNTLIAAARRNGRTLLVTVLNPQSNASNAVYKEAGSLLDWGFDTAGKAQPVGTLHALRTILDGSALRPVAAQAGAAEARGGSPGAPPSSSGRAVPGSRPWDWAPCSATGGRHADAADAAGAAGRREARRRPGGRCPTARGVRQTRGVRQRGGGSARPGGARRHPPAVGRSPLPPSVGRFPVAFPRARSRGAFAAAGTESAPVRRPVSSPDQEIRPAMSIPWGAASAYGARAAVPRSSSAVPPAALPRAAWVSPTASWASPRHSSRSASGAVFQASSRTSWAWNGIPSSSSRCASASVCAGVRDTPSGCRATPGEP